MGPPLLRRRLLLLTIACVLPVALMGGISLYVLREQQADQSNRVGLELARSVANAVDAELRASIAILQALGTSPRLDEGELEGFLERSRRVREQRPEWVAITLATPAGTPVLDTRLPFGAAIPPIQDPGSFELLVRRRAPVIGGLTRHGNEQWLFAVRVPVMRDGQLRYVLTALERPAAIHDLLVRQRIPEDWVISIVDARGRRVARSRAHEQNLGGGLSPSVRRVLAQGGSEGVGMAHSLEGERILTPYSWVGSTGWVAVLGIPTLSVDAAAFRSVAAYGGGILVSILLGIFGGLWVAGTITRPMTELRTAAEAVGRGESPQPPRTRIQEIQAVGAALEQASKQLAAAEVEREALLQKERRAREAAEGADRAKDEFLAVVSHELRTPLNAVYGWARLLQAQQVRDDATIARATDAIVRNSDVQVHLIDDLLDLSRITSGKMRLQIEQVELERVLQDALDAVRPAAAAKGITLRVDFDPRLGNIQGDPARLQQIAWNLLMNAVKFTPRGGDVEFIARRVESGISLVVRDTGQGIAREMLPYLFERFRQADSSSTRTHGGLGLGLALVKHLAELHGGSITAESSGEGQGATFTVLLPDEAVPLTPRVAPVAPRHSTNGPSTASDVRLDGARVMIVDDDPEALVLVEAILTRAGAEVRGCSSAAAALAEVDAWRPDVLLSDIGMPDEDGYTLIRKVRALPPEEGGATPAIAFTGFGRPHDRERAVAAGFDLHVAKPVDPWELKRLIAGLVGRQSTGGPLVALPEEE